ncbi:MULTISPECIES: hypothetical protein [Salinibaculum]|uniref:hypothetical protein n=1 Tax=Salinibaculum TaxID=2732368 RepID=UPI0030CE67E8
MARGFYAILAVLIVVLAGCSGAGPTDDGATPTATSSGSGGTGGTGSGGGGSGGTGGSGTGGGSGGTGDDGAGSGGSGTADAVWDPYDFREGEFYAYEIREGGEFLGTFTWEVLSVAEDSVTVAVTGDVDGQRFEVQTTGAPETAYNSLLTNPAGSYVFIALYGPYVGAFRGETLAIGQGWSYSSGSDSLSYRIERTDSIAGRDVFVTVVRENDVPQYETWIDADLAFAAKTVIYDEGEVDVEVRLTEYRD